MKFYIKSLLIIGFLASRVLSAKAGLYTVAYGGQSYDINIVKGSYTGLSFNFTASPIWENTSLMSGIANALNTQFSETAYANGTFNGKGLGPAFPYTASENSVNYGLFFNESVNFGIANANDDTIYYAEVSLTPVPEASTWYAVAFLGCVIGWPGLRYLVRQRRSP